MSTNVLQAVRAAGLLGMMGAIVYTIGDVLMLAAQVNLNAYPNLKSYVKLLSGAERMVTVSSRRLMWGGLLGVFVTPLVIAGFWAMYQGLRPAGAVAALPPAVLLACASIVGAFVHGSFIYLGEYVRALNRLTGESQAVLIDMFQRHRTIMVIGYLFLGLCIVAASIWFSIVVGTQRTRFPAWMAFVNPVTTLLVWIGVRRLLPGRIGDWFEGAAFNIAYLIFFAFVTATLWQAG